MTREIDNQRLAETFDRLISDISQAHCKTENLGVAAIADGGILFGQRLAQALAERLNRPIPCGIVNAAFHRDDIGAKPIPKAFHNTDLPFAVDDAHVLLADDVLGSGRTARAALSELFDQGRPSQVELVVLCDRGNRVLPIQPDYCGLQLDVAADSLVKVILSAEGPEHDRITFETRHD